jgi:hypothetical protein
MMVAKRKAKPAPEPVQLSILDVCNDPDLFGPWFKDRALGRHGSAF